ncbi:Trm112 family protein [Alicyclobacillus sp.]|uniref:Trm112 family protein n=1 Tax=Alicyclobacillus sp. TaxID=61169 RepID=UPI0025B7F7D1|nr:Trm112 family protein [Alicyclobacillus sp.]MCL6518007.1 hypothetical protein [Alicyclobacillus sp.]
MYEVPCCRVCKVPLSVVEQHIHEYLRPVTTGGKPGRPKKVGYRHVVNEVLKCDECGRLFAIKRDAEKRIVRGRQLRRAT